MERVIGDYMNDVKERSYPGQEHTVYMKEDELERFARDMDWTSKLEELDRRRSAAQ